MEKNTAKFNLELNPKAVEIQDFPQVYKPRENHRYIFEVPAFLETGGKIIEVNLVDASTNIIRLGTRLSLSFRDTCLITLKSAPQIQIKAVPIIHDQELNIGGWNRLHVKQAAQIVALINSLKK